MGPTSHYCLGPTPNLSRATLCRPMCRPIQAPPQATGFHLTPLIPNGPKLASPQVRSDHQSAFAARNTKKKLRKNGRVVFELVPWWAKTKNTQLGGPLKAEGRPHPVSKWSMRSNPSCQRRRAPGTSAAPGRGQSGSSPLACLDASWKVMFHRKWAEERTAPFHR